MEDAAVCKNAPALNNDDNLLRLLKSIMPTISTYKSLDTVTQANAEGNRILVQHDEDDDDDKESSKILAKELFVKRILASKYSHKAWPDLRRTLLYARTEVRFYSEILPQLEGFNNMTPHCYHAECNLEGLIPDNEHVLDVSTVNPSSDDIKKQHRYAGGTIVLSSLDSNDYYQESPLSKSEASQCLRAVAQLHAAAWENLPVLQKAQERLSKTSFHLGMRNPKELKGMVESWNGFMENFASLAPNLFAQPGIQNLGQRVHDMALYISKETSPLPNDSFATLVHGDYKAMNVFLPKDRSGNAYMIDFASVGVGLGMSDVAMHIVHALEPHNLQEEEELVDQYLKHLQKAKMNKSGGNVSPYPRNVAMRHYRLASIDYFRFILGRFWKGATPETFEKKKSSRNTTLVNRNVEAALAFIKKVDKYLEEIEAEFKESKVFGGIRG